MATLTVYQRNADSMFDRGGTDMILDTVTWTLDANGQKTGSTSSKGAITAIMQDLTEEDYTRISAGNIAKAQKKVFVRRGNQIKAQKWQNGAGATQQMFIHSPTDGTTTPPAGALKYEILQVNREASVGDFSPNDQSRSNVVYSVAYIKEVMATG